VYSVHLGTIADIGPGARRDQLNAVLADAARYPAVIVGGDLNHHGVGRVARDSGYVWATEHGPRTVVVGRFDHIFLKGFASPDTAAAGTILDVRHASDHRPVWAVGIRPASVNSSQHE
jgi:endonuclease/exonuclease/phosphatase family metal-dependent hydrolase